MTIIVCSIDKRR